MKKNLILYCFILLSANIQTQATAVDRQRPFVVAHRGLLRHAPENTLANFRACLELGLGFEFDVQRTKDGKLVCIHDNTLDRTTNGKGLVSETTLQQILQLDAGTWFDPAFANEKVPLVEEVLKLVGEYRDRQILVAVDFKLDGVEQEVVQLAEKHRVLHRLLFIGRSISESDVRDNLKRASASASTAAVANNADEFPGALATKNADWVYVRFLPTSGQMDSVHRAGKRAFIAGPTVSGDVPENWQRATRSGLDAILTDYPLILGEQLRSSTIE